MPRKSQHDQLPAENGDLPLGFPPVPIVTTSKTALPEPSHDLTDALGDLGVNVNPFATQQQLLMSGQLDMAQNLRVLENLSKAAMDLMKQRIAADATKKKEKTHEEWIKEMIDGDSG